MTGRLGWWQSPGRHHRCQLADTWLAAREPAQRAGLLNGQGPFTHFDPASLLKTAQGIVDALPCAFGLVCAAKSDRVVSGSGPERSGNKPPAGPQRAVPARSRRIRKAVPSPCPAVSRPVENRTILDMITTGRGPGAGPPWWPS